MITRVKGSSITYEDLTGAVSLSDLGAQNTDITTALRNAILAGKPIIVPVGTWLYAGATLPDDTIIIGFGKRSILKLKDASNVTALLVGSGCFLQDFAIDCNKANQVGLNMHGLDLTNAVRSKVHHVKVLNPKGCGYLLAGTVADCDLVNPSVTGYLDSGIKIAAGSNITVGNPSIYSSDAAATGDGIALVSNGAAISGISINAPRIESITGRGISVIGNGSRNVTDSTITAPRIVSATSHGIHVVSAELIGINGGLIKSCAGDGVRLEGDVQSCGVHAMQLRSNTGYAAREVVSGSTPNNNIFSHTLPLGNGNNVVTKVGANSVIS